jgi:hypothetical protein
MKEHVSEKLERQKIFAVQISQTQVLIDVNAEK